MNIELDFTYFIDLFSQPIHLIVWQLFISGGWVVIVILMLNTYYQNWIAKKRQEFVDSVEYAILAVDVPRENEQGPKAVEQIFAQLAAIESGPGDWKERNIEGIMKSPISLEIISMEGYIQFLIRVPKDFTDLAEAAIYSQYPDAEITEVEDYAGKIPTEFPSEEYDLWGAELVLQKDSAYPIKTYTNFEDPTNRDENFKDPMAAIMEVLSKIGPGENIWMQILAVPAGDKWKDEGLNLVKKMLGFKVSSPETFIDKAIYSPIVFLGWVHTNLWGPGDGSSSSSDDKPAQLTPGERKAIEAIEDKIAKLGFESKFRIVYWGDKEVFYKGRGVAATIGAIKQFSTLNLNGFIPDKHAKTAGKGRRAAEKLAASQSSMAKAYLNRYFHKGAKPFVLNTEELATLFHFPMKSVKAPLLQRSSMKVGEAPSVLPTEAMAEAEIPVIQEAGLIDSSLDDDMPVEMQEVMREDSFREKPRAEQNLPEEKKNKTDDAPVEKDATAQEIAELLRADSLDEERREAMDTPPDNLPII